jgi:cysteine desulfurase family protein (TIGR01976 family)
LYDRVMTLDLSAIRAQFPALARSREGTPVAWLDGPAGTQVPASVIAATSELLGAGVSNHGGAFAASTEADELTAAARQAAADLYGSDPHEVVFGQNMTSLTFAVSRSIGREWGPGDEVIVTALDHDANVSPWLMVAADAGATVRTIAFDSATGTLDPEAVVAAIGPRTALVAVTAASNALGSVTDLEPIITAAHDNQALVYVDAVHFSAHRLSDVKRLGPDFLIASAYKFFGPHTGILFGKHEHLENLIPYKVRPAPQTAPDRWETGTQAFESLVQVTAAIDYLASLGSGATRRSRLEDAFARIRLHEDALATRFLSGLAEMPAITLYGPNSIGDHRVSTFAIDVQGIHSRDVAAALGEQGIYVWDGDYYAIGVMEQLGLSETGGLVRVGFVHYTSPEEVDRLLSALEALAPTS